MVMHATLLIKHMHTNWKSGTQQSYSKKINQPVCKAKLKNELTPSQHRFLAITLYFFFLLKERRKKKEEI